MAPVLSSHLPSLLRLSLYCPSRQLPNLHHHVAAPATPHSRSTSTNCHQRPEGTRNSPQLPCFSLSSASPSLCPDHRRPAVGHQPVADPRPLLLPPTSTDGGGPLLFLPVFTKPEALSPVLFCSLCSVLFCRARCC
uniref:Uncharacterized protein n=1 Tax=Opuntia streptacantha TaxID=393608 RepID=A0A7C9DRF4_OPUST